MLTGEQVDVAQVAPSCACDATLRCSHDLLGEHHRDWIVEQSDVSTQQEGKLHRRRAGPNRVSNIDIDVEPHLCGRSLSPKGDAHAAVCVLVADCDSVGVGGVELESIILIIGWLRVRDRDDHRLDGADVVGRLQCCEVDIFGRRSWYAASRTPPLRTKSWLLVEAARRKRKRSSAYRRRYSSLARPDFFAIARRSKYARPASVARVGGGVRYSVIAVPPGRAGVRASPSERLWRPRSVVLVGHRYEATCVAPRWRHPSAPCSAGGRCLRWFRGRCKSRWSWCRRPVLLSARCQTSLPRSCAIG